MIGSARRGGTLPLYKPGMECPGCEGTGWSVGRISAECARCGMVLDLKAGSAMAWGLVARAGKSA